MSRVTELLSDSEAGKCWLWKTGF